MINSHDACANLKKGLVSPYGIKGEFFPSSLQSIYQKKSFSKVSAVHIFFLTKYILLPEFSSHYNQTKFSSQFTKLEKKINKKEESLASLFSFSMLKGPHYTHNAPLQHSLNSVSFQNYAASCKLKIKRSCNQITTLE